MKKDVDPLLGLDYAVNDASTSRKDQWMDKLNALFRLLRRTSGASQAEAGQDLRMTRAKVARLESGQQPLSADDLVAIRQHYSCRMKALTRPIGGLAGVLVDGLKDLGYEVRIQVKNQQRG